MAGPLARRFQRPRTKSHYSPISSDLDQFTTAVLTRPGGGSLLAPTPVQLADPTAHAEDFRALCFWLAGAAKYGIVHSTTLVVLRTDQERELTDRRGSEGPACTERAINSQRLMSSISTRSHH